MAMILLSLSLPFVRPSCRPSPGNRLVIIVIINNNNNNSNSNNNSNNSNSNNSNK